MAEHAHRKRVVFGMGLVALAAVTLGAAVYATVRPVEHLEGATLPSVLYAASVIDLLGALMAFTYETPAEIALFVGRRRGDLER